MSFANPTALFWASLAIPIVVFYILKIRLRRVPVSTIIFWRKIFEEKQPRSIWQHLRHLLSLLIQLFFLALLVFALAEPFFKWEILEARRMVLVLDNSASMNATDVEPSRLEAAKRAGHRVINSLRFRDELAIVAAGSQPQVFCGLTGHQKTLRKAIDAIPARDGPTRVHDAVALARRLLADHKNRKVIVLSDGCFHGATELALGKTPPLEDASAANPSAQAQSTNDLQWIQVGQRMGNVGITRFQVRRSLLDPLGYEILAEVANYSDDPVECRLELELDDEIVDVVPLKLEPATEWSQVFNKTSAAGGRLVAKIDRTDALVQDNRAWAILPRRERQPVLLVTEGNLFLQKVFEASPLVNLTVARELPSEVPAGTVVVLHRTVPAELPAGSVLVIQPVESNDFWEFGEKLQNPIVTKQDKDSPLMAHVRLDNVVMPEAHKLMPKGKSHALATSLSGDPLYFTLDRTTGKLLVLTVNIEQGDLPLRTAFPIMMTNALAWFAGSQGELRESLPTGAVTEVELSGSLPAQVHSASLALTDESGEQPQATEGKEFELTAPDGTSRSLPTGVLKTTIGPLDRYGIWTVAARGVWSELQKSREKNSNAAGDSDSIASAGGDRILEIACNVANRRESDLRAPEGLVAQETSLAAGFGSRPIWFYLIAVAWFLAAVEWFLYQRRWIS